MTGVKDEHTARTKPSFRRKFLFSLIAFFLVTIGWLLWQIYSYNNAVRMAKEAGFGWESENPISLIREDWRNALIKKTWGPHDRLLRMSKVSDLDDYREMLQHLRPNWLVFNSCINLQNVDALAGLNHLQYLNLQGSTELQNVDGLKNLTALEVLILSECIDLKNIDGLKNLAALNFIELIGCNQLQNVDALEGHTNISHLYMLRCTGLQNVDGLKGLTALNKLDLSGCDELQNVDATKGLTTLKFLKLRGCHKIPAADLRELSAALPNTNIIFPDGTTTPPP